MTGTPEGSTESGFMEKPGIEPATPGLQGIALIHYTTGIRNKHFYCSFLVSVDFLWQSFKHTDNLKNVIFSVTLTFHQ